MAACHRASHDAWRDVSLRQLLRSLVDVVECDDFLSKCLGAALPGDKLPVDQRPLVSGEQLAETVKIGA
jgi:hypothetical protein